MLIMPRGRGRPRNNPTPAQPHQTVTTSASSTVPIALSSPTPKNVLYFIECSDGGIAPSLVDAIENKLDGVSGDLLYLVIHTYGGDVYSAVKIMRILQHKFKEIRIIIPDFVYSSGTIMSLGGDKIYMAVDASIGPLDKPLEHPNDGSDISSLDITQALTNLASTTKSIGNTFYKNFRSSDGDPEGIKLSKHHAAQLAFETATKIINPIVEKIDPYNLQRGFRQAEIGFNYAADMLNSRMMKTSFRQSLLTSYKLVNDYPSHGYGIYRDEVKSVLKLTVENLEDLVEWSTFEPKFKDLKRWKQKIEYMVF